MELGPLRHLHDARIPDVAMDADPASGVLVYISRQGGWWTYGGTSLGLPDVRWDHRQCELVSRFHLEQVDGERSAEHGAGRSLRRRRR